MLGASAVLGREEYGRLSLRFLEFAWRECFHPRGGMARYHHHAPRRSGLLADQVETAFALQEAFSFTGDPAYLERAGELLHLVEAEFRDRESGRPLDAMPGFQPPSLFPEPADPISVSRASEAFLRQAFLGGKGRWKERARELLSSVAGDVLRHGYHASPFALSLDLLLEGPLVVRLEKGGGGVDLAGGRDLRGELLPGPHRERGGGGRIPGNPTGNNRKKSRGVGSRSRDDLRRGGRISDGLLPREKKHLGRRNK